MSVIRWAAVAVAVLCAPTGALAQTWSDWGETDARTLASAESGEVTEVVRADDGNLEVYVTFDGWLNVMLLGRDCMDRSGQRRCKKLAFNALFEVDDAVRSRALEAELKPNYVADMADGEDYVVERAVELAGGASFANIRQQLDGFLGACEQVSDVIWPPDAKPSGKGA